MRVLICGDRNWSDLEFIKKYLSELKPDIVIEGEARGADTLARIAAKRLGIPTLGFPADWGFYGKAAGSIRNQQMLDEGKPDLVVAFHDDFENSKGTKDMVNRSRFSRIETLVMSHANQGEDGI